MRKPGNHDHTHHHHLSGGRRLGARLVRRVRGGGKGGPAMNVIIGLLLLFCVWWALTILCACALNARRDYFSPKTCGRARTAVERGGRRKQPPPSRVPFHTLAPGGGKSAPGNLSRRAGRAGTPRPAARRARSGAPYLNLNPRLLVPA